MPAAVLRGPGELAIEQVPLPRVRRATDVLIDVEAAGVCGSDLHVIRDPVGVGVALGTVLGHELVGVVREVGEAVAHVASGDRVVVEPCVACRVCEQCRTGHPQLCSSSGAYGFTAPGGFAPHVAVAASAVHRLPDDLPSWKGALVEPLSSVIHGVRLARPFPGERALVIGAGPIGLLFTGLLTVGGLDVVAIEPSAMRAAAARAMGALHVVEPGPGAAERVRELTGGLGPEIAIDAVGTQLPVALASVRRGGRVVVFGVALDARVEIAPAALQNNDVEVFGANVGRDVFAPALRLVAQGRLDLAPLVSHRVALEDLPAAIDLQRRGEATKVLVELAG
jgi:threonine dehydrogenase-like Zn-dependent dehydrogenase